jgi:TonB family protein
MAEAWKAWEGQVVDAKFRLRLYLGGSEHSAVFLTEHGDRGLQKAAIKLIATGPGNAKPQLSRWRQAAKLSHPHVIRLFETGQCSLGNTELLYMVMEYAEEDLAQVLPHRPLTPEEAGAMLKPVLDALAYLHGKGFVHGHIKPANIMAVDDQVKISRDGVCRMGESGGGVWKPSVYDPPESSGGGISAAGDIWSLGIMLVEALTQGLSVWNRADQREPALPETVPEPFLDIARHCLQREPHRRWTVAEIAARLRPTSPTPQKQMTGKPQMAVSKRLYIVPTVAVGLALVAFLVGPRLLNRRAGTQRAAHTESKQSGVEPKPEKTPVSPETELSRQRTSNENQGSPGVVLAPLSLPSGPGAKASSGGRVRGEVFRQVLPRVPQKARDTVRGTVRVSVRVAVDPAGAVVGATFDSPGPSRYFANLALQAARRWEFEPPNADGRDVSSEWILRFDFRSTGTKVIAIEAAPPQPGRKQ